VRGHQHRPGGQDRALDLFLAETDEVVGGNAVRLVDGALVVAGGGFSGLLAAARLHEAGVKDFEALQWHGLLAPAKTPSATIMRIHAEVIKVLTSAEVKERFASEGAEIVGSTPSEFSAFIRSEIKKWAEVVQRSGARID
jgi:hypothetical protein